MTVVEQAVAAMEEAKQEILKLRQEKGLLQEALEELIEAIPRQSNDLDWWPDELTHAVLNAKRGLEVTE